MIMGILSLTAGWICYTGFLFGTLGIIFSAIGISAIKKDPTQTGKGMAMAGLIMSIIAIAGWIVIILLVFAFVASVASGSGI